MATALDGLSLTSDIYRETEYALWCDDLACTDRVSDELLAMGYMRFKQDGLLPYLFYEGEPTLTWFMEHFSKNNRVEMLAVYRHFEEGDRNEHLGFGWLNSRTSVGGVFDKMEVGFGFFKEYHQPELTKKATRLMIEFAFRFLGISAMFGTTPEKNVAAVRAAKRIGFEIFGPVPHFTIWEKEPCGVYMSALTKQRWEDLKREDLMRMDNQ